MHYLIPAHCYSFFQTLQSVTCTVMSDLPLNEKIKDLVAGNDKRGPEAVQSQLRALGAETQSEEQHALCLPEGGCP